MTQRITGADLIRYDERTDTREVVMELTGFQLERLNEEHQRGLTRLLPGQLAGWGRERTLRSSGGAYYHVDLEG